MQAHNYRSLSVRTGIRNCIADERHDYNIHILRVRTAFTLNSSYGGIPSAGITYLRVILCIILYDNLTRLVRNLFLPTCIL
jgi:hypothetical protein